MVSVFRPSELMKKIFFGLFILPIFLCAQPSDSDSVGIIYIGCGVSLSQDDTTLNAKTTLHERKKANVFLPNMNEEAIYRRTKIIRIVGEEEVNRMLFQASYPEYLFSENTSLNTKIGLINGIIEGLRTEKYVALNPKDMRYTYSYSELLRKVKNYQYPPPTQQQESVVIGLEEFGIKDSSDYAHSPIPDLAPLTYALDLVVEEGVLKKNTRSYFRILYLRLLWYDSQAGAYPEIAAVFPYYQLKKYLEKMYVRNRYDDKNSLNVDEYLQAQRFYATLVWE